MSYRQKYYKYKQKYFQLKKELELIGGIAPNDPESISQEELELDLDLDPDLEAGLKLFENQPAPIESGPTPIENNDQDNITDTANDDNFDVLKILDKIINK